ncbi:MAG TPA: 4'-phosphopantetheinyl transferase superfamily protein [Chthoniobacterales bacterium]|jgi:4'-phosphopantetheinyl transferase
MSLIPDISAWTFDLDEDAGPPCLDSVEEMRANGISNPLMRSRYQRTRSLVRRVLAERLGLSPLEIPLEIAPGGKPQLTPPANLHFSISHSRNFLVIAVSPVPIGVDIELLRPRDNTRALAERFFSKNDFATLEGLPPAQVDEAFLHQWVAKEAALKAAGIGLGDALRHAECQFKDRSIHAVSWPGHCAKVTPFTRPGGIVGAFAWFGEEAADIRWMNGVVGIS